MEDENLSALHTELLLAVQGLGSSSDGEFAVNARALERLKEIDLLLRKDNPETQYVHFYLGQKQALQSHIIPLAIARSNDGGIIFQALKILTRLTMPLSANVENYLQRLTQLHDAKQAIISGDVIAVLMSQMAELSSIAPSERKRPDNDALELICSLFKNLLAIPNPSRALASSLSEWDLNLQDRCILKLGEEHVFESLVTLAEGCSESKVVEGCEGVRQSVTLMLLQCFYYLFKNETEDDLLGGAISAKNVALVKASKGVMSEKEALVQRLKVHQQQQVEETFLRSRGQSSRHSRFGTMIVQSSQLGARPQLVKNVFSAKELATDLYTDDGSSRKPCPDAPPRAYFNERVRQILFDTATLFLTSGAYNELMSTILLWLQAESTVPLPEDAACFIHVCYVLMGVHRLTVKKQVRRAEKKKLNFGFTIKDIRATLSKEAFNFLYSRIKLCFEIKPIDYAMLATCMSMYKEIIRNVYEMTFHGDEETKLEADEMRRVLFDDTEHVKVVPQCFKVYSAQKNNQRHLTNLIHSAHFSIRILTYMAKIGHKVQSKRRKKQKKSINSDLMFDLEDGYVPAPRVVDEPEESVVLEGEQAEAQEAEALQEEAPQEEPTNDVGERENTKKRKKGKKKGKEPAQEEEEEGDDGETTGAKEKSTGVEQEEEQRNEGDEEEGNTKRARRGRKQKKAEEEWEYDEEEGFEEEYSRREHAFNLEQYISSYIHHQVVRSYCQLLSYYKVNSLETNGCILKFFELICAEPYNMSGLFFQLSVLVLFEHLLSDETIHRDANFADLRLFCKTVVRRFLDAAADNSLLFLEALWLKTPQFAEQLLEPFKVLTSHELRALHEEQESRKEMQRQMEEEADMEEAGLTENTTWVPKPQSATPGVQKIRWTKTDDALLVQQYPSYKDLEECLEMLGSLFQPPRDEAAVRRRLKALGLLGRPNRSKEDIEEQAVEEEQGEIEAPPLPSASDLRAALPESKEDVAVLVALLEKCYSFRQEGAVDLALVPTNALEWEILGFRGVKALTMVGCRAPEPGQIFWRLPATARLDDILALLKDEGVFSNQDVISSAGDTNSDGHISNLKRDRSVLTGRSRLKKIHVDEDQETSVVVPASIEQGNEETSTEQVEDRVSEIHEPLEAEDEDTVRVATKRKKKVKVSQHDEDE